MRLLLIGPISAAIVTPFFGDRTLRRILQVVAIWAAIVGAAVAALLVGASTLAGLVTALGCIMCATGVSAIYYSRPNGDPAA